MTKLWFKAKRYGYGWYPATWEGWLVVVGFIVLASLPSWWILTLQPEVSDVTFTVFFIPYILVLVTILITISVKKGEKARWRWGK